MPISCLIKVLDNKQLTDTVSMLTVDAPAIADSAKAGQFLHIRCGDNLILRRPISICDVTDGVVTIVVEQRGEGTAWLIQRSAGDTLDVLGPLGNGFDISGKNTLLVGGGIGVPPMLYAARSSLGATTAVIGFRSKDCVILQKELQEVCRAVYLTTDDGSAGECGPVTPTLTKLLASGGYDGVLACGPRAMLQAVAAQAQTYDVPCQVSLEERMGCGVGACLVCACRTTSHGIEKMSHVCKDGPVFNAQEVLW